MKNLDVETATDMERTIDMINHIKNPCYYKKDSKEYLSLRESYIAMAENMVLPTLTNPYAKSLLEKTVEQYRH